MNSLTPEEMVSAVKFAGTCLAYLFFIIGGILGAILESRFDFIKW